MSVAVSPARVSATPTAGTPWLRGPAWDLSLIAFPWLPFALWMILGPLGTATTAEAWDRAFSSAVLFALAVNFIHRHYVFVLVYGDAEAFALRRSAYLLAPVAAVLIVGSVVGSREGAWIDPLLIGTSAWNVWHVIMQRYGILRLYAKKAGGGLESAAHARRDRALLLALALATGCLMLLFRRSTFRFHPDALALSARLGPLVAKPWVSAALSALLAACALVSTSWLVHEVRAQPTASRWPRALFVLSMLAILATFLVAGPVVGYLTFGLAHSSEYIAFVHHFGERKYSARGSRPSFARLALSSGLRAPALLLPLLAVFWLLKGYRASEGYLVYYVSTGLLHFLYDGWVWKLRRANVGVPLAIGSAPASQ